jgi:GMP synthase-like glutamine amidotransferase
VAIENPTRSIFGFQFHPEVAHTEGGMEMLKHWLTKIAKVRPGRVWAGCAVVVAADEH